MSPSGVRWSVEAELRGSSESPVWSTCCRGRPAVTGSCRAASQVPRSLTRPRGETWKMRLLTEK